MGPDNCIDRALFQPLKNGFPLSGRAEAIEECHFDRIRRETLRQGAPVLLSQHGGGRQHGHLFAGCNRLEDGADGHFGFSEAHIPAHQAVHRLRLLHVPLHFGRGLELIRGWLVGEGILKFVLPRPINGEGKTRCLMTLGIELHQIERHFANSLARPLFRLHPGGATHLAELGRTVAVGAIAAKTAQLVRGHPEDSVGVLHHEVVAHFAADGEFLQFLEPADAVVSVHHKITGLHLVGINRATCRFAPSTHVAGAGEVLLSEEFPVGDQHHPPGR